MESLNNILLIAPCGMNCSICLAYMRERNKCPGCRGSNINKPVTRAECKIKNCATFQKGELTYCYECENYPCDRMKHLDTRYRTRYRMSMIENLENIRKYGIRKFLENEKIRWICSKCGGTICVHKGYCYSCLEIR